MSDFAILQNFSALVQSLTASLKCGYLTLHRCSGMLEFTEIPGLFLGCERCKINLTSFPPSLGTSPMGDCMKYLKGTSLKGPAYLLFCTSLHDFVPENNFISHFELKVGSSYFNFLLTCISQ